MEKKIPYDSPEFIVLGFTSKDDIITTSPGDDVIGDDIFDV